MMGNRGRQRQQQQQGPVLMVKRPFSNLLRSIFWPPHSLIIIIRNLWITIAKNLREEENSSLHLPVYLLYACTGQCHLLYRVFTAYALQSIKIPALSLRHLLLSITLEDQNGPNLTERGIDQGTEQVWNFPKPLWWLVAESVLKHRLSWPQSSWLYFSISYLVLTSPNFLEQVLFLLKHGFQPTNIARFM